MPKPAIHSSWTRTVWPHDIVPVPLGPAFRPLDPGALTQFYGSAEHFFFVAPLESAVRTDLAALVGPAFAARPDVGIFYGDDAVTNRAGEIETVHCKPSFNAALLLADDYMGFPLLVRADVFSTVALEFDPRHRNAGWYRLCLAASAAGIGIDRIPETLLSSLDQAPRAGRRPRLVAVSRRLKELRAPLQARAGRTAQTLEIRRDFRAFPEVTLVVRPSPAGARQASDKTAGRPSMAEFLDGLGRSSYPPHRITVLIGDDGEGDTVEPGRRDGFGLKRVEVPPATGESARLNRLWRAAETDLLILVDRGLIQRSTDWIEALLTFSMDRSVGGVGARVLDCQGRVEHAGLFGGFAGGYGAPWRFEAADAPTFENWAWTQRDCSAVSGAVFATRRAVMEAVNGFDESFSGPACDVDLCLRMRMLGYRVVYTPFSEMARLWETGRDAPVPAPETARFISRWRDYLDDDPMYSPQLRADAVAPREGIADWARSTPARPAGSRPEGALIRSEG